MLVINLGGNMDKRKANISFGKSGNGTGARLILSVPNLKKMGIDIENRTVTVEYDFENKKIIISKEK
jgi:hypothetical protein F3_00827